MFQIQLWQVYNWNRASLQLSKCLMFINIITPWISQHYRSILLPHLSRLLCSIKTGLELITVIVGGTLLTFGIILSREVSDNIQNTNPMVITQGSRWKFIRCMKSILLRYLTVTVDCVVHLCLLFRAECSWSLSWNYETCLNTGKQTTEQPNNRRTKWTINHHYKIG